MTLKITKKQQINKRNQRKTKKAKNRKYRRKTKGSGPNQSRNKEDTLKEEDSFDYDDCDALEALILDKEERGELDFETKALLLKKLHQCIQNRRNTQSSDQGMGPEVTSYAELKGKDDNKPYSYSSIPDFDVSAPEDQEMERSPGRYRLRQTPSPSHQGIYGQDPRNTNKMLNYDWKKHYNDEGNVEKLQYMIDVDRNNDMIRMRMGNNLVMVHDREGRPVRPITQQDYTRRYLTKPEDLEIPPIFGGGSSSDSNTKKPLTELMYEGKSDIQGIGLFARKDIPKNTRIMLLFPKRPGVTEIAGKQNHCKKNANTWAFFDQEQWWAMTKRNIKEDEELLLDYDLTPYYIQKPLKTYKDC